MRGAWLLLSACALSFVRADTETPMPADRVTPMPADPELNAKWLQDFRRELMRDAYDDETTPKPPPSSLGVYRTRARETTSDSTPLGADHALDKMPLPARRALGAVVSRTTMRRTPTRRPLVDAPGPLPDALIMHRTGSVKDVRGHMPGRLPPDALGGPLVGRLSGKTPARHSSDEASVEHSALDRTLVGHVSGGSPKRSPDDAASRELGISRRDLYGGRGRGSIAGLELDAKRQPFLNSIQELDDQMIPVVIQQDANSDNQLGRARMSRKRLWHANSEQYQDKPPYIVDQNGIKRYRVHTDPRERFRNQFGEDEPGLKEEWGFNDFDEMRGREDRYQGDGNLAQNKVYQSRDESSSREEGVSVSASHELNVSEYQQENVRSWYVQDERPERDYARQFSARRDAALLADGLASSKKPCNCVTEHPHIIPEL